MLLMESLIVIDIWLVCRISMNISTGGLPNQPIYTDKKKGDKPKSANEQSSITAVSF